MKVQEPITVSTEVAAAVAKDDRLSLSVIVVAAGWPIRCSPSPSSASICSDQFLLHCSSDNVVDVEDDVMSENIISRWFHTASVKHTVPLTVFNFRWPGLGIKGFRRFTLK